MSNFEDILNSCQPDQSPQPQPPRLCKPAQMDAAITGTETRQACCYFDEHHDQLGTFTGVDVYLVDRKIQHHPDLFNRTRTAQMRPFVDTEGNQGVVYNKQGVPGQRPNTWTLSGEQALEQNSHLWGRIVANHNARQYVFEPLSQQPAAPGNMPKLEDVMEDIFKDKIIDSPDHPVVKKLTQARLQEEKERSIFPRKPGAEDMSCYD